MTRTRRLFRRRAMLACVVALAFAALGSCVAPPAPPRGLAPLMRADRFVVPDRYIVVFNVGRSPLFGPEAREAIAIAQRQSLAAQELVRRFGGTVGLQYNAALIGFSAKLPLAALDAVRTSPGVAHVETVREVFADDKEDLINWQKGLDRIDQRLLKQPPDPPLDKIYYYSETGLGVNVYVIDSGLRTTHVDFQDTLDPQSPTTVRAFAMQNFAPHANGLTVDTDTTDCNGHGTMVAGIIGGYKLGVAKRVKLFSVRVLGCNGRGTTEWVLGGINHVYQYVVRPAVVNMSVGAYRMQQAQADLDNIAAQEAGIVNSIKAGLTYVVSAGNDPTAANAVPDPMAIGEDACTKSPAYLSDPAPGVTEKTITVGAIDPLTDKRWQWSNRGTCVDLFAPGVDILMTDNTGDAKLRPDDGTSFAAPHVAGAAARYLQTYPLATPAQVWAGILTAANVKGVTGIADTPGWGGITDLQGSPNIMLHWGSVSDGTIDGDPHVTTVDGVRYDFQGAGEFVALRDASLEIQTRQAPVPTAVTPLPDAYTGLTNCVSVNTAVAARVGTHRVTFQPNLSGIPDPSGLQLRIDGRPATADPNGLYLNGGGRIAGTPAGGIDITFPDGSELLVTPGWWAQHGAWHLNLSVLRTPAREGIMGAIASGSWLPALPNGASLGPMPSGLAQRHVDLNEKFMDAWRVSDASSLFDYAPGTSVATFTRAKWPPGNAQCAIDTKPQLTRPVGNIVAHELCHPLVDNGRKINCIFDVAVTGAPTFANTYLTAERVLRASTRVTVYADRTTSAPGEAVALTAIVERRASRSEPAPIGVVQFLVDGKPASDRIRLDPRGRASWRTSRLDPGVHRFAAHFNPGAREFLPSGSLERAHTVGVPRRP